MITREDLHRVVTQMTLALMLFALAGPLSAQTVRYIHTDALGSVVALTDAGRNVIERREYEPYGSQLTPAISDGPGYTGHVQDASTGLTYMQQRYYDPSIGRFLSVDPITVNSKTGSGFNRYAYVLNNPFISIDPDGRREKTTGSNITRGFAGSNLSVVQYVNNTSDGSGGETASGQERVESQIDNYGIEIHGADIEYDPWLQGADGTAMPGLIYIGPGALTTYSKLRAVIHHEGVHILQILQRRDAIKHWAMNEAEAYKSNLKNAARFLNTPAEVADMEENYFYYYNNLSDGQKRSVDNDSY